MTTKADIASDYVVCKLSSLGANFYRVNTEDLPLEKSSTVQINSRSPSAQWSWISADDKRICLDELGSIWFRRHRLPVMPVEMSHVYTEYCLRETDWFLKGAIYSRGIAPKSVAWMSHPWKIQAAESKTYQLSIAKSVGLLIPDTLISNDPHDVRAFFDAKNGAVIAKPLRLGYFDYGDKQTSVYTSKIEEEHLKDDQSMRVAPVIYQELLSKLYDIRVTIVGQQIFAVAIESQAIASASIDWRKADTAELRHITHELPANIAQICLEFMNVLGLNYGALDFVLTPENEYIFLEVNPNGQWVWIEDRLNLPISDAIADWLFTRSKESMARSF